MSRLIRSWVAFSLLLSTAAGAAPVLVPIPASKIVAKSSNPFGFTRFGSYVYFNASDEARRDQLWRSDGTEGGTAPALPFGGQIIGTLGDGFVLLTRDLSFWRSAGTPSTTFKLGTMPSDAKSAYRFAAVVGDSRLFVLTQQSYLGPADLWTADGSSDSLHFVGRFPAVLDPQPLAAEGKLYFLGVDAAVGEQLWVSDGTLRGTHMVRRPVECPGDSCAGVAPLMFFRVGSSVCFLTSSALWRTDGTAQGTVQIAPLDRAAFLGASAGAAYVRSGDALWRTDGTAAGTRQAGAVDGVIYPWVMDDGRLVFTQQTYDHYDLWTSDGAATVKVMSIPGGYDRSPFVGAIGNRLFLAAGTEQTGLELWLADLESGSAALVKDIDPSVDADSANSSVPLPGAAVGSRMIFSARNIAGREPWVSDGTAEGTRLLANIAADPGAGAVSGSVRDAAGAPVAGAAVILSDSTNVSNDVALAGADGRYRFDGLVPGTYTATAYTFFHLPQIHASIQVAAGFENAGIDFRLTRGGWISGTVRRAATGAAVAGSYVHVRNAAGANIGWGYTDGDGRYFTSALPAGVYFVEAGAGDSGSDPPPVDQLYRDKNCPFLDCDLAGGTPVAVALGRETPSIDFALREYGTISGTLRDASDNAPLAGLSVSFYLSDDASAAGSATTDASGVYHSPHFLPGSYYVRFEGGDGYDAFVHPAAVAVAFDTAVTGIDLPLPQKNGRITGVLRDRAGVPFANVSVGLRNSIGEYAGHAAITDAAGRYRLIDVRPGRYYLNAFDELYPNVDCPSEPCSVAGATPIDVAAGTTLHVDMQSRWQRTTIRGRLVDGVTGDPIDQGVVRVFEATGQFLRNDFSDHGAYTIEVMSRAPSMYITAEAPGYRQIAYPSVRVSCNFPPCPLPPGAATIAPGAAAGIDFRMQRLGVIRGTVTDAVTGAPVAGAPVVFVSTHSGTSSAYTNAAGEYRWPTGDGSFYVYVDACCALQYAGQVYRGRNCNGACDAKTGDVVSVPDGGETSGIDFRLQPAVIAGRIAGRVVDDVTGAGIADVIVTAKGPRSSPLSAVTDANGNYAIAGDNVIGGDYRLYAETEPPYLVARYGAAPCAEVTVCDPFGGAAVHVTGPSTTAGIDFRLPRLRVTAVSPDSGAIAGGTRIVIQGLNFAPNATVTIGENEAMVVSVTPEEIVALTPAASAPGPVNVMVALSPRLHVTLAYAFTYTTPRRRAAW